MNQNFDWWSFGRFWRKNLKLYKKNCHLPPRIQTEKDGSVVRTSSRFLPTFFSPFFDLEWCLQRRKLFSTMTCAEIFYTAGHFKTISVTVFNLHPATSICKPNKLLVNEKRLTTAYTTLILSLVYVLICMWSFNVLSLYLIFTNLKQLFWGCDFIFRIYLSLVRFYGILTIVGYCCDADKRKTRGTQKGLIEKHIYSSNRNKIQVNLVKLLLVDRKLRVQWDCDYPSTTQMVSLVIVSHWLVNSVWRSQWLVFMESKSIV